VRHEGAPDLDKGHVGQIFSRERSPWKSTIRIISVWPRKRWHAWVIQIDATSAQHGEHRRGRAKPVLRRLRRGNKCLDPCGPRPVNM